MTPDQIREARRELGLSAAGLARALRLGRDGTPHRWRVSARTVRGWEAGDETPSGPAMVALAYMLAAARAKSAGGPHDIEGAAYRLVDAWSAAHPA